MFKDRFTAAVDLDSPVLLLRLFALVPLVFIALGLAIISAPLLLVIVVVLVVGAAEVVALRWFLTYL
jgi:hypothetical protein